jgi:hypothetical protein
MKGRLRDCHESRVPRVIGIEYAIVSLHGVRPTLNAGSEGFKQIAGDYRVRIDDDQGISPLLTSARLEGMPERVAFAT